MLACFRLLNLFSNVIISFGNIINPVLNKRKVDMGFKLFLSFARLLHPRKTHKKRDQYLARY